MMPDSTLAETPTLYYWNEEGLDYYDNYEPATDQMILLAAYRIVERLLLDPKEEI